MAISIPGPRQVSLSSDLEVAGPACRLPTLPKDASATSRVLPALRLQRHGFPQSTQPNSSICHMTRCCIDRAPGTSFLHRSVHLCFEERLSLSVGALGPMEQEAIVCKSPFISLSRHLLEQSLNRPMVRRERTRRLTKCGIETREPAGAKELSFVGESSNSLFVCWLFVPTWKTS